MYKCNLFITDTVRIDERLEIGVCRDVYPPAEDSWLLLEQGLRAVKELRPSIVIDVGSGTGVIYITLASLHPSYGILIDISSCAVYCSLVNVRNTRLIADVVQCDNLSCVRVPGGALVIYNTPYLPSSDDIEESVWWQGGAREAVKLVKRLAGYCSWTAFLTIADTSPIDELIDAASRAGVEYAIVAEMPEDLFTRVYVVRLKSGRCDEHRRH